MLVWRSEAFLPELEQLRQPIATTGVNGLAAHKFEFKALTQGYSERLPTGTLAEATELAPVPEGFTRVKLCARKSGFSRMDQEFELDLSKQHHELNLTLSRGLSIFGHVVYADGSPVVGAQLIVGVNNATTNEQGEILGRDSCENKPLRSIGVSGFRPGDTVSLSVLRPAREVEERNQKIVFERSDVDLNIVLLPARRILLTLMDCGSGKPLEGKKLSYRTYRFVSVNDMDGSRGDKLDPGEAALKDVELWLGQPTANELILTVEGYMSCRVPIPAAEPAAPGALPTKIEACLQPIRSFTIEAATPDGMAVGNFRLAVTMNRLSKPWTVSFDRPPGGEIKLWEILQPTPITRNSDGPIESVELSTVQCILPDLRLGTLTDMSGVAVAPQTNQLGAVGELFAPISLIDGSREAGGGTEPLRLRFIIVPPGGSTKEQ